MLPKKKDRCHRVIIRSYVLKRDEGESFFIIFLFCFFTLLLFFSVSSSKSLSYYQILILASFSSSFSDSITQTLALSTRILSILTAASPFIKTSNPVDSGISVPYSDTQYFTKSPVLVLDIILLR